MRVATPPPNARRSEDCPAGQRRRITAFGPMKIHAHVRAKKGADHHPNCSQCSSTPGPSPLIRLAVVLLTTRMSPSGPHAATSTRLCDGVERTASRISVAVSGRPHLSTSRCSSAVDEAEDLYVVAKLSSLGIRWWLVGPVRAFSGSEKVVLCPLPMVVVVKTPRLRAISFISWSTVGLEWLLLDASSEDVVVTRCICRRLVMRTEPRRCSAESWAGAVVTYNETLTLGECSWVRRVLRCWENHERLSVQG